MEKRIRKYIDESVRAEKLAQKEFDSMMSEDLVKDTTAMDRHLQNMRIKALETYASVLRMSAAWEVVRTRLPDGKLLEKDPDALLFFLFGGSADKETLITKDKKPKKETRK